MPVSAVLSALLLLASTVSAQPLTEPRYVGGIMTFSSKKETDGSYRVDIRYRESSGTCYLSEDWSCESADCGNVLTNVAEGVDIGGNWCQSEGVMTRTLSSNSPFVLQKRRCCWISNTVNSDGEWLVRTHIDLGERSDTFKPNRSPVVTTLPLVRVPQNCARNYNLLSSDPDNDQVRCRYGDLSASECGMCNQHVGFTLDENTCTLSYANASSGVYAFELVMEDYPTKTITLNYTNMKSSYRFPFDNAKPAPLSKIPIQFALQVEDPAPSCTEGDYLPQFIDPTPRHGDHLQARVNQTLEFKVKATAAHSSISNVIFSKPLKAMRKPTGNYGEYVVSLTPTSENYGQQFPFCFIAQAVYGFRIYQSEMRCVIVVVEDEGPKAEVTCTKDNISVSIERANIPSIDGDHLRVNNNASCTVSSNSTHLFTDFSLSGCGTQMEETDEHLLFKNTIVFFDTPNRIITRKNEFEIEVMCKYQKKSSITTGFKAHRPAVNFTETGFGSFSYQFEFYQSSSFNNMQNPSSYPLAYDIGETIYMEIAPINDVPNIEVFLESCVATPYDNPDYPISYPIITDGCGVDETVNVYTSHQPSVKFSMEAFKFIGQYDQVFISCSIIICQANNSNTRCAKGCIKPAGVVPANHLHKREAAIQTESHFISQGPLRLRRSASLAEAIRSSLNLVFVAGCVVAVVAMVCGMMVYKSRGSKVNYQLLKSDEI